LLPSLAASRAETVMMLGSVQRQKYRQTVVFYDDKSDVDVSPSIRSSQTSADV
jgi:hypothetical protein